MIEDKTERVVQQDSPMADRPAGPNDRETESGLIYGRWYGGAQQDCGCDGVPEGIHVPGCEKGLCTSPRAVPDAPGEVDAVATALTQEVSAARAAILNICANDPTKWRPAHELKLEARGSLSDGAMSLALAELLEEQELERNGADVRAKSLTDSTGQ